MQDEIVGTEIDGYRIRELVGSGGMGVVYRAEDVSLSRDVALKCINRSLANDESFLRRFRAEARALAQIDSPYIVQVHTLSRLDIGLVIVMEFVEGGNLHRVLRRDGRSWRQALPLIRQMLTALEHAHSSGVIHRDIKPHNILLAEGATNHGNRVKVTDFGLAKMNANGGQSRTVTEGIYGSINYMSPEQIEGLGEVDRRSDIYSLGMTLYEMLAGRLPFEEEGTTYRIMRTIVEEDLPSLSHFTSEVPDALVDVVMTTLEKDPDDRFQSAAEMKEAIDDFAGHVSGGFVETSGGSQGSAGAAVSTEKTVVEPGAENRTLSAPSTSSTGRAGADLREAGRRKGPIVGALLLVGVIVGVGYFASAGRVGFLSSEGARAERPSSGGEEGISVATTRLPPSIKPLVEIDNATALEAAIDEGVQDGHLIRGEGPSDFFIAPEKCFIFVLDETANTVTAVIDTGSVRVDVRSGRRVSNWSTTYEAHPQIWVATTR